MKSVVCDAHTHVFRPAALVARPVDDLVPADRDAPVEDLIDLMDANDVTHAMLVPLTPDDDYVPQCVARYPDRFVGTTVAGPTLQGRDPEYPNPLDVLRRQHERFTFRALRTGWLGVPGADIADSPMMPVLRYLSEHGIALWSYLPTVQLPLLEQLAAQLPELVIVLNHFGFCPEDMRVDGDGRPYFERGFTATQVDIVARLAEHQQVFLMFSGHYALSHQQPPYADIAATVRRLTGRFGANRAMWASDFPWTRSVPGYPALLDLPAVTLPDASTDELSAILGGTAARLFQLNT